MLRISFVDNFILRGDSRREGVAAEGCDIYLPGSWLKWERGGGSRTRV